MAEANSKSSTAINGVPTNPNLFIINPANQITSIKLNDDNYLLWNLQILAGIRGLGLDIFILEDAPVPSRFATTVTGEETTSPLYLHGVDKINFFFLFC